MEIVKKLSESELQEIKTFQEKTQSAVIELGHIELSKLQLKDRTLAVEKFLNETIIEEKEFVKRLEETYGKGTVNIQTGEITLIQE